MDQTLSFLSLPIQTPSRNQRWEYRGRVLLRALVRANEWRFGFIRDDEIIPIEKCPIHSRSIYSAISKLQTHLTSRALHWPLHAISIQGGSLVLVLKEKENTDRIQETSNWNWASLGIKNAFLHFFPSAGRKSFHNKGWVKVFGPTFLQDQRGEYYGPTSFQQLLPGLHGQAIQSALLFFQERKSNSVLDLYSGTGKTLDLWMKNGMETIGVEWSGEAIEAGILTNPNRKIWRGLARERIPQILEWLKGKKNLGIYVNPSRMGIEREVLEMIVQSKAHSMAYLSCSPGTLKRDLEVLKSGGFELVQTQAFDFFPQTIHVEVLALLKRSAF